MATQITTVGGFDSGDNTISTDKLENFFIDAQAGDDVVTLSEAASDFELLAAGGEDLVTVSSNADDALLKGGADDDTFDFAGAIDGVSVYGGKGGDSITFDRTVVGGVVSGDTGADFVTFSGKVSGGASISGGAGDDTFKVDERLTDVTIRGGESRDSVDINENSEGSLIDLGTDDDDLNIVGKHTNITVKGAGGDDTLAIDSVSATVNFSGSGNKFYGGKGDDTIEVYTEAKVAVYGDNDDDIIFITNDTNAAVVSEGASLFGGGGNDSIFAEDQGAASTLVAKGNSGNDTIEGGASTAVETIFGGQGNDTIFNDGGNSVRNYYGDKGDDSVTIVSSKASYASGGIGDDTITVDTVSGTTDEFHSIDGGAGVDTISVEGTVLGAIGTNYELTNDTATRLYYSSAAEFLSEGDVIDSVSIANGTAVQALVSESLSITTSDEFDRIAIDNAIVTRNLVGEGLIIATASTVTEGSTVVLDDGASLIIAGVDLSAGTTGNSTIDNSADTTGAVGMLLAGGAGKNTIKGGDGADAIVGEDKNDLLLGNDGTDRIVSGDGLKDTVDGGDGNDTIVFGTSLNSLDSVVGGAADTDVLTFTDGNSLDDELTLVTGIETITLGQATTSFDVFDSNVAAGETLTINASALQASGNTLTLDASAEADGNLVITGGEQADTITGGSGSDTITADQGVDIITLNGDTNDVVFANADEFGDEITGFTEGSAKDEIDLVGVAATDDAYSTSAKAALDFGNLGMAVISDNTASADATMTATEVTEAAISGFGNIGGDETAFIVMSADVDADSDVFVYKATANENGAALGSVALVATLKSITLDNLHSSNFDLA